MKYLFILLSICFTFFVHGQPNQDFPENPRMSPEMTEFWLPQPNIVKPGKSTTDDFVPPPSDAIILFDGTDLSEWEAAPNKKVLIQGKDTAMFKSTEEGAARWNIIDGNMLVNKEVGDIQTKRVFNDFQLHIEWCIPEVIHGEGQRRGNSGIFMQGIYELQVLDSYDNVTYANGQAGSIYKQTPPLVNAMLKPGEWNTYDIIYTAPTFREDGTFRTRPLIMVLHNGILIQNNTTILGTTPYIGLPQVIPHGKGPIRLQAHADRSEPISFRNIWIREL
jgi:hypothetical protein